MGINHADNELPSEDPIKQGHDQDPIRVHDWAIKIIKQNFSHLFKAEPIVSTSIKNLGHGKYYLLTVKCDKSKHLFLIEPGEHITRIEDLSDIR